MDNETIIKLVNAGYSKEDIAKMDAGAPAESAGDSAGEDVPKGNEDAGQEQGAAGQEHESEINKTIKALTDTVAGLSAAVKAMQDANVKEASVSKPTTDKIKETMDSFIESL